MNYFELFDLAVDFDLDTGELARRYRSLQQQFHPDRFASGSEREKLTALQKTAQINDGFQTLKTPLSRAEHMLALRGIELAHEQRTLRDPEFLMKQMELREALEDIDSPDAVYAMDMQLQNEIKLLTEALREEVIANDNDAAADTIRKLKFMHKLRDELERIEDSLMDSW